MENASKALIIAGGILLAMMILSLMVYMGTTMNDMAESQDRQTLAQQTKEFNDSYLAYNKTRMYGTDVITVVNKAIDYNKRLDTDDEEYFINISLDLKTDFETTSEKVTIYGDGRQEYSAPVRNGNISLKKGIYDVKVREGSTQINQGLLNFFAQDPDPAPTEDKFKEKIERTYTHSALTNFKRAIFKCNGVHYSEETGRIDEMIFTQLAVD